jgi:LDH2 family malate/lactate/ureidoglycolate dehydrogenase
MAIDVDAMSPSGLFTRKVQGLIDEIHGAPCADGVNRLFVPGEMEWERFDLARQSGMSLPSDVWESLQESATLAGLELDQEIS